MADILPVIQAAAKASAIGADAGIELNQSSRNQFDLYKTVAGLFERQGNNAVIVESAKQAGALETQAANDLAASQMGTDLRQPMNRLTGLTDSLHQSMAVRDQALAAVNKKQRVGLFDNPLHWVLNQITVNDDIAKYNAANAEVKAASEGIAVLTRATDAQVATQKAIQHSVTTASAVAAAENTKLAADINVAQANIAGWDVNAKGIERAVNMSNAEVANKNLVFHAQMSVEESARSNERLGLERTRASFDEEQRVFQRKTWDEQLAVKQDIRLATEEVTNTINIGLRNIGSAPISNAGVLAKLKLEMSTTGKIPEEFLAAYQRGRATLQAGPDENGNYQKIVAPDPAGLINTILTTNIKWAPAQAPVEAAIKDIMKDVADLSQLPNGPKKPAELAAAFNKRTDVVFGDYRAKIIPGDKDNPYNVGSLVDVIKQPSVAGLGVVVKVLAPLTATQEGAVILDDPSRASAAVLDAFVQGKISFNEAVEFPLVYGRAVQINNAVKQFKALGLPESQTYNVKLPSGQSFSGTQDLASTEQWKRYLNKELAFRLMMQQRGAP